MPGAADDYFIDQFNFNFVCVFFMFSMLANRLIAIYITTNSALRRIHIREEEEEEEGREKRPKQIERIESKIDKIRSPRLSFVNTDQ